MSGACPRAAGSSPEKGEEEAHGYVNISSRLFMDPCHAQDANATSSEARCP